MADMLKDDIVALCKNQRLRAKTIAVRLGRKNDGYFRQQLSLLCKRGLLTRDADGYLAVDKAARPSATITAGKPSEPTILELLARIVDQQGQLLAHLVSDRQQVEPRPLRLADVPQSQLTFG